MEGAPPFSAESTEELDWEHSLEAEDLVPDESQLDEEVTPSEGVAGDVEASLDEAIPLDEEAPFIGDGPDEQKSSTQYLNEILEIPGISAVIAVGRDGFVIESAGALGSIDMDLVGASVAMVLSGAERVGTELELSEFETLTLESDDALIMCTPVGEALLAILAPDSKGLGMIRLQLRKLIPELAQMF
jgi:predicted regulator of Ras-like GTPase activity (Roadblock/LC7/MglB family)